MATSAYCPLECRSPTGFGASRRTQERPHGQRLGNGLRRPSLGPALPAPLGLGPDADMNGCQSGGMTTRWKPRLAAYQEVLRCHVALLVSARMEIDNPLNHAGLRPS